MPDSDRRTIQRPSRFIRENRDDKPKHWPPFEIPTPSEIRHLAEIRNIGEDGLTLAAQRGLLRMADYRGARCWIICDPTKRVAQARQLDGKPFGNAKAITLRGSCASIPVGIPAAEFFPNVLLVEGGPDLLAAHHFITCEDREADCAVVGVLGASMKLDTGDLAGFKGKHVRIFAHVDHAGQSAARRWLDALRPVVRRQDRFDLSGLCRTDGQPVKDLNDLTYVDADDFEKHRCLWSLCPRVSYAPSH